MTTLPTPSITRCLLVSAALLAFLVAVVSPPKAWAAVSTVKVTATNLSNFDLPVDLESIGSPQIENATYTVKSGTVTVTNGYTLKQILDYAAGQDSKLDYSQAESVTVGALKVMAADIDRPFSKPPVFFETESGMTFVKQSTSTSSAAKLGFTTDPLISIRSRAKTTVLPVTLTASDRRVEAGETVDFTAGVNAGSGASLSYTWTVSDGTVKTTNRPDFSHKFGEAGKFDVSVAVTDSTTNSNGGDSVTVQVGEVKKEKKKKENDDGGDQTGSYTPPPDYGYGGYDYGTPGAIGGSGYGNPGGTAAPGGTPSPQPAQPAEPAAPVDDGLETITGELVSSTAPAATIDPAAPGAPEAFQNGGAASESFGLPREAWTVFGILALFGFGMLAERRNSRLS